MMHPEAAQQTTETPLSPAAPGVLRSSLVASRASTSKPKRSSVACRRCRRLRTKCVHSEFGPRGGPCLPCQEAGSDISSTCAYTSRGDNADRRFRIKRISHEEAMREAAVLATALQRRASLATTTTTTQPQSPAQGTESEGRADGSRSTGTTPDVAAAASWRGASMLPQRIQAYASSDDIWSLLPPHEELLAGCRVFLATCLQVGFIPKALFLEQMETSPESVDVFLLVSILTISVRFTPALSARFRSSKAASEFFMDVAHVVTADQMWHTTLENTQAFFLLGMADWGRGDRDRSAIHMGIAVRMAGMLRLHREETYRLPAALASGPGPGPGPGPGTTDLAGQVVSAERARRTFWCIQNHDNLYTQAHLPRSFAKADITTLLPGEEDDFAFGRVPLQRAALAGTVPATRDPMLASLPTRSLFSTLIQAHDLWGIIARKARGDHDDDDGDRDGDNDDSRRPWRPGSQYWRMAARLRAWEADIPQEHTWSPWNLRGFKAAQVDLAYLSVVTVTRLNNIVLRRAYLDRIVKALLHGDQDGDDPAPPGFWEQVSFELFSNAWSLYEAVDVWFSHRGGHDGFPAMLAFCTYVCGSLASHLYRWPRLCPRLSPSSAATVLRRSIEVLSTFEDKWPTASQWSSVLRQVAGHAVCPGAQAVDDVRSQEALLNDHSGNSPAGTAGTQTYYSPAQQHVLRAVATTASLSVPSTVVSASVPVPATALASPLASIPAPAPAPEARYISTDNHLHLMGAAAACDTSDGLSVTTLMAEAAYPGEGLPIPAGGPVFDLTDPLADPLDVDFTEIVQSYMQLGWAGW